MALAPSAPMLFPAVVSGQRCQSSCSADRRGGVSSRNWGLQVSPPRYSVFSAWLNAQVPSGFLRGSRAEAMALAPSAPMLFPAVVSGQCCQSSCSADRRGGLSSRERGLQVSLDRFSLFSAWLNAQVPSGFLRGSRAEERALAPSAPMLFTAVVSGQHCHSS